MGDITNRGETLLHPIFLVEFGKEEVVVMLYFFMLGFRIYMAGL